MSVIFLGVALVLAITIFTVALVCKSLSYKNTELILPHKAETPVASAQSAWFVPSVHRSLTQEEVKQVSDDLNYACSPELIDVITEHTSNALSSLDILDGLNGYIPEVKYPRTPGRKPLLEENPGNAWAWLCDIRGSPEGKLSGKKVAIKDNTAVAGVPMSNGSHVLDGYVPEYDATVVTRILDAGGQITGKTAVDDFCCSAMGFSSIDKYIHLPHTPNMRVGGSSSGSGVLVVTGDVDLALAADQGGSIRIPSAWCGVVGLKATFGLIPYTGVISIEPTVDHVGPIARNVTDCALFLELLAGNNGVDHRQKADIVVPEYSKMLDDETKFTIGILQEGFGNCDLDVQALARAFMDKASVCEHLKCIDVSVPLVTLASTIFLPMLVQGAKNCLDLGTTAQFLDGFHSTSLTKAIQQGVKNSGRYFSVGVKQVNIMGEIINRRYGNHYYSKVRNIIVQLRHEIDKSLAGCDVLVMPTLTKLPQKVVTKTNNEKEDLKKYFDEGLSMIGNTVVYNMTGHPALTIPLGKVGDPSQPGLMIVGNHFDEVKVLQVGRAMEKIVQASL